MSKNKIKICISIFITIVLAYFIIKNIDLNIIIELIKGVSIKILTIVIIVYFLIYFLRALRFKVLDEDLQGIRLNDLMYITFVHGLFNRVLPARTGELSFVYLTSKRHNISLANSTILIIQSRLFDLLSVCILFFAAVLIEGKYIIYNESFLLLIGFIIIIVSAVSMRIGEVINFFIVKVINNRVIARKLIFSGLKSKLYRIEAASRGYKANKTNLLYGNILSIAQWLLMYIMFWLLINQFSNRIPFAEVVLGSAYSNITNILPINGFGGFGTMEVGWVIGFSILGMDKSQALGTGFLVNMCTFFMTVLFGIIAIIFDKFIFSNVKAIIQHFNMRGSS